MEKQTCQLLLELKEKVLRLKQEMKNKEKEICLLKDQCLAKMEYQCHLLTCLNKLKCQQIAECQEKLNVFTLEFDHIKEELTLIHAQLEHHTELKGHTGFSQNHQDILDKMLLELRCGVCSELMVFATSLNCMHTLCQYCVAKWKSESPTAGCPICREPIRAEKRNFLVDNMIAIMISLYSKEEQSNRRKFEKEYQDLHRNLLVAGLRTPEYNNPFYRITDRGLVLGEMQIEELPSIAQNPPSAVSSSAMVASIVRNLTRNPLLSRERLDNRRRIHYTRLLANIGRRRLMPRNRLQSIPPCSPENSRPPVINIGPSNSVPTPRIGETALALTCLYIAVTLFLYYTLLYLHVLQCA